MWGERSFLLAVLVAVLLPAVSPRLPLSAGHSVLWPALGLSLALALWRLFRHRSRWQVLPAHLALLTTTLAVVAGSNGWITTVLVGLSALLVAAAAVLTEGFPITPLPAPNGRYRVGTTVASTVRVPSRDEDADRQVETPKPRELTLQFWFPTEVEPAKRPKAALWSDLRKAADVPGLLKTLTRYQDAIETHSILDAPIAQVVAERPVLLYHPGLVSFCSENTRLVEELASHGYLIVSLRHVGQREELFALQKQRDDASEPTRQAREREILGLLAAPLEREERARLSRELYSTSLTTPRIVGRRALDSRFVLDDLEELLAQVPGGAHVAESERHPVVALGLSLGGAVATELSKVDSRVLAVANLDGGLYGERHSEPVTVPYLMLYSEANEGANDAARETSTVHWEEVTIPGTAHLSFHDAAVVFRLLGWLGKLGSTKPGRVSQATSDAILAFLETAAAVKEPAAYPDRELPAEPRSS